MRNHRRLVDGLYQTRHFLSEGAKKRAYLARDTKLDRDVSFTLIKFGAVDADALARIRPEAQITGRVGHHPHRHCLRVGEERAQPYFVSQHIADGDLEGTLAGTRSPAAAEPNLAYRRPSLQGSGARSRPERHPPRPETEQRLVDRGRNSEAG